MGVLWIAEHRALGIDVVVKFLNDERARDPRAPMRVAREAATAARVQSAHVVKILDHGVVAGTPYIAMELLQGCDLRALLANRGCLSVEETTAVVHQLAKALTRTHEEGIVHRDVKPSNVFLVDGEGEVFVKLLDFGLAYRFESTNVSNAESRSGAGTPLYMSPEQVTGETLDSRSDVWSLGVVAFECLTGRRPFEGETFGAIALAIHTARLPCVTDCSPSLPIAIDGWFARACARSRDDRFATAMDAAQAISDALGVVPTRTVASPSQHANRGGAPEPTLEGFGTTSQHVRSPVRVRTTARAWIVSAGSACVAVVALLGFAHAKTPLARNQEDPPTSVHPMAERPTGPIQPVGTLADPIPSPAQVPIPTRGWRPPIAPSASISGNIRAATPPSPSAVPSTVASISPLYWGLPDERH